MSKNLSLFLLVLVIITSVIAVTVTIVISVKSSQDSAVQRAVIEQSMTQMGQTIIEKTTHYLMPAIIVAESSARFAQHNIVNFSSDQTLRSYLINQLKPYPHLSKLYLADDKGNFTMAFRDDVGRIKTKSIDHKTGLEVIQTHDTSERPIDSISQKTNYNPKIRPWYIGARQAGRRYWTDLYMFYTGKRPGITASYPIFDQQKSLAGVFGVDIELSTLSEFLARQKRKHNAHVYIINDKSQIVAQSGDILFKTLSNGTLEPITLDELDRPSIVKALDHANTLNKSHISFKYKQNNLFVSLMPFPEYFGKSWRVMTVISEAQINAMANNRSFPVVFLFLALACIAVASAWILTHYIKTPLNQLSFDIARLTFNNIESKPIKSRVKEITGLVDHYETFKKQVVKRRS